ncbi:hypothetical protein TNCV_3987891 [Trichonephila clavipes]|nr:hypothetical protein TNCV_3987891 [Trichonephila clavipes]
MDLFRKESPSPPDSQIGRRKYTSSRKIVSLNYPQRNTPDYRMFTNLQHNLWEYGSLRGNRYSEGGPYEWLELPGGNKMCWVPFEVMVAQMTAVMQVCFLQCSCEKCHLAPNEDISDYGCYANLNPCDVPLSL